MGMLRSGCDWFDVTDTRVEVMIKILIGAGVILMITLIVLGASKDLRRTNQAKELGMNENCQYIGRARDLNSVAFFDCDGKIVMWRVE